MAVENLVCLYGMLGILWPPRDYGQRIHLLDLLPVDLRSFSQNVLGKGLYFNVQLHP